MESMRSDHLLSSANNNAKQVSKWDNAVLESQELTNADRSVVLIGSKGSSNQFPINDV